MNGTNYSFKNKYEFARFLLKLTKKYNLAFDFIQLICTYLKKTYKSSRINSFPEASVSGFWPTHFWGPPSILFIMIETFFSTNKYQFARFLLKLTKKKL